MDITDPNLLRLCKFRACGNAKAQEIHDIFTDRPGVFDDIITVDKLLDNGCISNNPLSGAPEYQLDSDFSIWATVNRIGIVDHFTVIDYDYVSLYYSKRYDSLFMVSDGKYTPWIPDTYSEEYAEKIKNDIAKLYR